jgi:hypothetical protein
LSFQRNRLCVSVSKLCVECYQLGTWLEDERWSEMEKFALTDPL